jgi:methionyl aminopeptidase
MRIWKEGPLRITIKESSEIAIMREGGKILGIILSDLQKMVIPGTTTKELNDRAESLMHKYQVEASFKGYRGYPSAICASINEEVVHGIPGPRKIMEGDIVTIDCGVFHKGFHTDSAISVGAGTLPAEKSKLIATAEKALVKAIEAVRPGIRIRVISEIIQNTVEKNGYSVIRDLVGHGIGREIHEDPQIPNFRDKDPGPILQTGMTIAIEPIIAMGDYDVKILRDGWTFVTKDKSPSAQVEHTVVVTEKGAEILTKRPN